MRYPLRLLPNYVQVSVQCALLPYSYGLQRQRGKKVPRRQSQICVLCLPKSHSERCQSPYTSWIYGSFVCWQEKQSDKTAGRLASISPPPGAPLDAVHIAGCFKFLSLEELSCVIFFQRTLCLLTGELSERFFFFVIWWMFSCRWKEGYRSEKWASEIVCLWLWPKNGLWKQSRLTKWCYHK